MVVSQEIYRASGWTGIGDKKIPEEIWDTHC